MHMHRIIILVTALTLAACGDTRDPDPPAITGVAYIGATVSDLEATSKLYANATQMAEVEHTAAASVGAIDRLLKQEDVVFSTKMLRSVNAQVRFMQFAKPSSPNVSPVPVQGPGIAHLCYQVDHRTETYERFLDGGAKHIGSRDMVQINPKRPVYYAYAKDLDDIVFEVEHVDVSKLDLDTPPENQYRIRHISLATPDIGRLVDFYGLLLDDRKPRRIGRFGGFGNEAMENVSGLPGTKVKMAWLQTRNLELEIVQYVSHPTELPGAPRPVDAMGYNMIVFDVSDLDIAKRQFVGAGGTIVSDVEQMDGAQILFGRDPDGNLIGLQLSNSNSIVSSERFKDNGI